MTIKDGLTPNQLRGIEALMSQATIKAAAESIGVNKRTILNWLELPHFVEALRTAQSQAIDATVRRLAEASSEAVTTLRDAMGDDDTPPAVRVRAADVVLSQLARLTELRDLEARVSMLEQKSQQGDE